MCASDAVLFHQEGFFPMVRSIPWCMGFYILIAPGAFKILNFLYQSNLTTNNQEARKRLQGLKSELRQPYIQNFLHIKLKFLTQI